MAPTDGAGMSDSGVITDGDGGELAVLESSGLIRVCVPDPADPPRFGAEGEVVHPGGILFVAAPEGTTVEQALGMLGEPGEVKGPSARVWGDDHAARFGASDAELAVLDTPQGDGEPVKGPSADFAAEEVIDPPSE